MGFRCVRNYSALSQDPPRIARADTNHRFRLLEVTDSTPIERPVDDATLTSAELRFRFLEVD